MNITLVPLLISILSLAASFFFVGIIPSIAAFVLNIFCVKTKRSITTVRALAVSFVGVLLPFIMYFNTYGLSLPYEKNQHLSFLPQIIYDNYTKLGFDMSKMVKASDVDNDALTENETAEDVYFVADGVTVTEEGVYQLTPDSASSEHSSLDDIGRVKIEVDEDSIFEAIDSNKAGANSTENIGKSDDDMPSYGGLPIGTLIIGQYFREDDHNCNPVLVLQNKTGGDCRFECVFTARDEDGNELAVSNKTVEAVKDGSLFVFEGRFDKNELGSELPAMYEFLISKREPYENEMSDDVAVFGEIVGNSVLVTAQNTSKKRVKVDAYVLFFDGKELVDCIWMIPRTSEEVTIDPGSAAAIKADAYYRFNRIETYYTAYEAVGE